MIKRYNEPGEARVFVNATELDALESVAAKVDGLEKRGEEISKALEEAWVRIRGQERRLDAIKLEGPMLSRREWYAGMALQGMCASKYFDESRAGRISKISKKLGDALIAELDKDKED